MSAASFLGISGLVFASGFDGLIYSIGFLVGWPVVLFLIAERLRNLGKFTFSDVASFRLDQTQIRILSATGTLVVVAFYLIAQMVGAGKLIQLLFGLDYLCGGHHRRHPHDRLRRLRRHEGDDLGADHQGVPAPRRRNADIAHRPLALWVQPGGDVRRRREDPPQGRRHHGAGRSCHGPDLGHLSRHGADVRHRRAAAHPDAVLHRVRRQGGAQVRVLRHGLHRLLLHPDLHHRLRGDHVPDERPELLQGRPRRRVQQGHEHHRRHQHGRDPPRERHRRLAACSASSRRSPSRPSSPWWPG